MADIRLDNLTLGYDRHPAVHHVSGHIAAGTMLAVVGPNGAGKSTLLKGMVGLLAPLTGAVERHGLGRHDIAYLPQQAAIDRSFPLSVRDLIAMGDWRRSGLFGAVGRPARDRLARAIAAVGLSGFEGRGLSTLSGGQLQRALFARLIVQDAPVILLDEPFAAIDQATTADMLALIRGWSQEGRTVVAVLHDIDLARRAFGEALLLARETVAWGTSGDTLTDANLSRARHMVEAFDPHAAICAR
jgi:zinc/manganese transport system ATP-binding protein